MQLRVVGYCRGGWALPDNVSCVCLGSTWVELDANIWPTGGGGRHGLASAVVFISDSCLFYSRRGKLAGWRTCVQGIIHHTVAYSYRVKKSFLC